MFAKQRAATTGFTLTELLVLIGVGSVLTGVLLADLSQTRAKLLQQACAANMKQWGMAFDLYSQDYNGKFYYDVGGVHYDDIGSPLARYLGQGDSTAIMRNMRICPTVAARMTQEQIIGGQLGLFYSYSMPIGMYKRGIGFVQADSGNSPFFDPFTGSYFPSLSFLPQPSSFLLLIESRGNTLRCGGLVTATTTGHVGSGGDQVPAINRHGGSVNCLFGDFHVELVSAQMLTNQDAISCSLPGNPWFILKQ
jgi:prepilin-type processing-associated H-X9-DG protein